MQIKLHLDPRFKVLNLSLDGHRDILPKNIQINGCIDLDKLDRILSSIDSSILSFGKIWVKKGFFKDF
jgi:hypothetical protein